MLIIDLAVQYHPSSRVCSQRQFATLGDSLGG